MTTIGNWIINSEERGQLTAVEYKENRQWKKLSWQNYVDCVVSAYSFFANTSHQPGDHIGIMSSTRWEWSALDLALLGSQKIVIPMYPNLSDSELLFVINHSDIKSLVFETEAHQKQLERLQPQFEREIKIIKLQDIDFFSTNPPAVKKDFFSLCEGLKPDNTATIVYTSGTTGTPKGAVLLHSAIVSEVVEGFKLFGVKPSYKALTFLPFAHVLGRIEHWGSCYNGHCLAYAESIERIKNNLKEVQPDFLIAVPRIFEKVYSGIMTEVETKPYKQKIFSLALDAAQKIQRYRRTKEVIPWTLLLKYQTLNQIAFSPIQQAFGGQLKFAISGGAPISSQLVDFFSYCGIPLLEGYGLTETCAAICVNTLSQHQTGTVGKAIGDVELKIAEDGEILVKSLKCLKEYYKNEEETEKNIVAGYFATGDIGVIDENGFLKITDRKKDLIKTAGGKYVAPQKFEGLLKQDPLVSQVLIHGDQKKFIVALISFDEIQIKQWAQTQDLTYDKITDLYQHPALRTRLQKHVKNINSQLASFEAIKKFEIVTDSWTVENGCLTQSLKVKRKFVEAKYAEIISEMYE